MKTNYTANSPSCAVPNFLDELIFARIGLTWISDKHEVLIGALIGWKLGNEFAPLADSFRGMAKLIERFQTAVLR